MNPRFEEVFKGLDPDQMMNTAQNAARKAGKYLLEYLGKVKNVQYKGAVDLVTEADKKSEGMLVQDITSKFKDHGVLAEEGTNVNQESPVRWIFDPLDGTTNYAHTYPCFSVSMGCEVAGVPTLGVVYDPTRDEMFSAVRGKGAHLNGNKITVSSTADLLHSILATGFPYVKDTKYGDNVGHFRNFLVASQGIRRGGSAALDLCYVASGRLDGFWEFNLKPWDTAAGVVIVTEAGGKVTKTDGSKYSVYVPELLATNSKIHAEAIEIIKSGI